MTLSFVAIKNYFDTFTNVKRLFIGSLCKIGAGLGIGIIVTLSFWPATFGGFFFDDEHFILKNKFVIGLVSDFENIKQIYSTSVTEGAYIQGNFYRPNQQFIFGLIVKYMGLDPFYFHALSIFFHLVNVFLVYFLLRSILAFSVTSSWFGAAFFGVHPVQTQAVCYISGLADPLSFFFMLSSLLLFIRCRDKRIYGSLVYGVIASFFCINALLSKENAVVIAPLWILIVFVFRFLQKKTSKIDPFVTFVILFFVSIYVILRFSVLNFNPAGFGVLSQSNEYTQSLTLRLTTFVNVLWDYFRIVFWPRDLFYERPYIAYRDLGSLRGYFGLGVIFVTLLVACFLKKIPWLFFGLMSFFVCLGPYMGWVPLNAIFLEHWLYTPMLGMSVLFAGILNASLTITKKTKSFFDWRRVFQISPLFLGLLVIGALSLRTFERAKDWASETRFYLNEIAMSGGSLRIYNNLGMVYAERKEFKKALTYYDLATSVPAAQKLPQPYHNKARIYLEMGDIPLAIKELYYALKADHEFIYSLLLLRDVMVHVGFQDRALILDKMISEIRNGGKIQSLSPMSEVFRGFIDESNLK